MLVFTNTVVSFKLDQPGEYDRMISFGSNHPDWAKVVNDNTVLFSDISIQSISVKEMKSDDGCREDS